MLTVASICLSAQVPNPTFRTEVVAGAGNTVRFINTTPAFTLDSGYHAVFTWTFGDMGFIQNPTSDTVLHTYTNAVPDSTYPAELGLQVFNVTDSSVTNPYVYNNVHVVTCLPVIDVLPNDSFGNNSVLPNLANDTLIPMFIWTLNGVMDTLTSVQVPVQYRKLKGGDTVGLYEILISNTGSDMGLFQNVCQKEVFYVVPDSTTGIFSLKQGNAELYVYNRLLTVNSETMIKRVQLFNSIGQSVFETNTSDLQLRISLQPQLTNGIYIVAVTDANEQITTKKVLVE